MNTWDWSTITLDQATGVMVLIGVEGGTRTVVATALRADRPRQDGVLIVAARREGYRYWSAVGERTYAPAGLEVWELTPTARERYKGVRLLDIPGRQQKGNDDG